MNTLSKSDSQRQRIYEAIVTASDGLTDDELQAMLGLDGNTQRPRRRELDMAGKITTNGRRTNVRGNWCAVWVAA